jgi:hypothetical protein
MQKGGCRRFCHASHAMMLIYCGNRDAIGLSVKPNAALRSTYRSATPPSRVGLWEPHAMAIFEDEEANRSYPKQATIHRSNSEWTMSRLKASPPNWKRPTVAASLVPRRPPVWRVVVALADRRPSRVGLLRTVPPAWCLALPHLDPTEPRCRLVVLPSHRDDPFEL